MRFKGRVVKRLHGVGSKSEHEAVYLDGPKGAFKLRLPGGNPFQDPRLDRLVGKSITADGELDRVSDNLRKGAALNAVQIAELLGRRHLKQAA